MQRLEEMTGTDWTELADYFGVDHPFGIDPDDMESKPLKEFLTNILLLKYSSSGRDKDRFEEVVDACRFFLDVFIEASKDGHYGEPLFKGLAQIEEDETFLKFFTLLFPAMWI